MDIKELGWNEFHEKNYDLVKTSVTFPARVIKAVREKYWLYSDFGELRAEIKGNIRHLAASKSDFPVVGDWVVAEKRPEGGVAIINSILPRINKFSRKEAGQVTGEQVLVSNIDEVFLVNGLDKDYNIRRIERYLAMILESNSKPVIVLNKTDLCPDLGEKLKEVGSVASGVPILTLSALNKEGIEDIKNYITSGTTISFIGSSGVGKSTIINCLLGSEKLKTGAVRESDSRGRHVTCQRELMLLPGGGIVIDNPGLRELQLWAEEATIDDTFDDVRTLGLQCKFSNCTHTSEPGCAVLSAIENGTLDDKRIQSFHKLKKELKNLSTRKESKARNENIITGKKISKLSKQIYKHRKINRSK